MPDKDNKIPNKEVFMPTWLSLPSEWDASVSQVEMLQQMLYNINCIIQYLEDLQTNYESYTDNAINNLRVELTTKYDTIIADLKAYHDSAVKELYSYIDTQDSNYWIKALEQVTRLDKRIDELIVYVNSNFDEIRKSHSIDVDNIYKFIESTRKELMTFIELNNQSIMEWVEVTYQDILDKVDEVNEDGFRILNPTTGEKDKVENTVLDVYNALRVFVVTAQEWDDYFIKLDNTGEDFKRLNMSALEFDTRSWLIMYGFGYDDIISPVTGLSTTIQGAIEEVSTNSVVTTELTGNLTCEQWDNLNFDQNDYEVNFPISAYEHDFQSAHIFDNQQIITIGQSKEGYIREYYFGIVPENGLVNIILDGDSVTRRQINSVDVVNLLPLTLESFKIDEIIFEFGSGNTTKISIYFSITPEDIDIEEVFIKLVLTAQPLIPLNISNTNPPKPVPLGNITAEQWDNYFNNHNGNDFKALNMSAYEYDTNSVYYITE